MSRIWNKARVTLKYGSYSLLASAAGIGAAVYYSSRDGKVAKISNPIDSPLSEMNLESGKYWNAPSRNSTLQRLEDSSRADCKPFDLLIIGGGATGVGCALDASTRGYSVALVEAADFASGTSSKSTKLVHGGVRYLEKAFWNLDMEQFRIVNSALKERGIFLKSAPFLAYKLPLLIPNYSWWQAPYYYTGTLMYSMIASIYGDLLCDCGYFTKREVLNEIPTLNPTNLIGAVLYYDGAHNDSRMNTLVALTAAAHGATVTNYVEVLSLLKKPRTTNAGKFGLGQEEIYGAICRDKITNKEFQVHAKGVISAVGPMSDKIRGMDLGYKLNKTTVTSRGTHIVVPSMYGSSKYGLLDARSSDGRVLFILPWENSCLIGTTDVECKESPTSTPTKEEVDWIIKETNKYLKDQYCITPDHVTSIWSGIRPMVTDPNNSQDTENIARNHVISLTEGGLLVINGGKWTTYREMAEDTINEAIKVFNLPPAPCVTDRTQVIGAHNWDAAFPLTLCKAFFMPVDIAAHLSSYYGDRAMQVARLMQKDSQGKVIIKKLVSDYPYLEEEVIYALRHELARKPIDVVARRTRLAFIDMYAAYEVLPKVVELMSKELNWSSSQASTELKEAQDELREMGYSLLLELRA